MSPEELKERTHELEHYPWFSKDNRKEAMGHAMAVAAFQENGSSNLCTPSLNHLIEIYCLDRSEHAVALLRQRAIEAKLFAVCSFPKRLPFRITSTDWDWNVYPLKHSGKPVPDEAVRNLMLLHGAGVIFDGVGIAVPETREFTPFTELAKDELRRAGRFAQGAASLTMEFVSAVLYALKGGVEEVYSYADGLRRRRAERSLVRARRTWRDPVLLGMYKTTSKGKIYLVEVARWQ
jgi:hypothetical protein